MYQQYEKSSRGFAVILTLTVCKMLGNKQKQKFSTHCAGHHEVALNKVPSFI